jgi:hypothetical protein
MTANSPTNKNSGSGEDELREQLAAIEHERWADWQAWCHKILRENCPSPELEKVLKRWDLQIETTYDNLTSMEKDSDREQVDRYWPLIRAYTQRQVLQGQIEELKEVKSMALTNFKNTDNNDMYVLSEYCKYRITNLKHELTQQLNDVTEETDGR